VANRSSKHRSTQNQHEKLNTVIVDSIAKTLAELFFAFCIHQKTQACVASAVRLRLQQQWQPLQLKELHVRS